MFRHTSVNYMCYSWRILIMCDHPEYEKIQRITYKADNTKEISYLCYQCKTDTNLYTNSSQIYYNSVDVL